MSNPEEEGTTAPRARWLRRLALLAVLAIVGFAIAALPGWLAPVPPPPFPEGLVAHLVAGIALLAVAAAVGFAVALSATRIGPSLLMLGAAAAVLTVSAALGCGLIEPLPLAALLVTLATFGGAAIGSLVGLLREIP